MGAPKATDTPTAAAADSTYVQAKQTSEWIYYLLVTYVKIPDLRCQFPFSEKQRKDLSFMIQLFIIWSRNRVNIEPTTSDKTCLNS